MADVKHTPGPWQIEGKYQGDNGSLYLSTMHPMPVFELHPLVGTEAEHLANARLIAAAPDLLDALTTFVDEYVALVESGDAGFWDAETEPKVIAARAAIAKAEGRS